MLHFSLFRLFVKIPLGHIVLGRMGKENTNCSLMLLTLICPHLGILVSFFEFMMETFDAATSVVRVVGYSVSFSCAFDSNGFDPVNIKLGYILQVDAPVKLFGNTKSSPEDFERIRFMVNLPVADIKMPAEDVGKIITYVAAGCFAIKVLTYFFC